jgi:hypothetical protein
MTEPVQPLRPAEEVADPLNVASKQTAADSTTFKPVPKSWKPIIASKADGSPVIIYVAPKVHAAITEATS